MDTVKVITETLHNRMENMREWIEKAQDCYYSGDFVQCAVRLEKCAELGKFSEFEMRIFESESKEQ